MYLTNGEPIAPAPITSSIFARSSPLASPSTSASAISSVVPGDHQVERRASSRGPPRPRRGRRRSGPTSRSVGSSCPNASLVARDDDRQVPRLDDGGIAAHRRPQVADPGPSPPRRPAPRRRPRPCSCRPHASGGPSGAARRPEHHGPSAASSATIVMHVSADSQISAGEAARVAPRPTSASARLAVRLNTVTRVAGVEQPCARSALPSARAPRLRSSHPLSRVGRGRYG